MEAQSIVSIRQLQVAFGKKMVLRGVNLEIPAGGVTAVLGPSGCGKTVLLKALNRMNELEDKVYTGGSVLLAGVDIYSSGTNVAELRARVGMVFQKPAAFNMSVYDNVAFAPRLYGTPSRAALDEIVEHSLEATGLWDEVKGLLKKNAYQLTEGQQQRLCIARSLAASPEVLLMDEPTSTLDSICKQRVENLVERISKECTVVLCTDDVHQAVRVADRCAFMLDGEILETGSAYEMMNFPKNEKAEQFILGQMA